MDQFSPQHDQPTPAPKPQVWNIEHLTLAQAVALLFQAPKQGFAAWLHLLNTPNRPHAFDTETNLGDEQNTPSPFPVRLSAQLRASAADDPAAFTENMLIQDQTPDATTQASDEQVLWRVVVRTAVYLLAFVFAGIATNVMVSDFRFRQPEQLTNAVPFSASLLWGQGSGLYAQA
jgi:hypothetical protein